MRHFYFSHALFAFIHCLCFSTGYAQPSVSNLKVGDKCLKRPVIPFFRKRFNVGKPVTEAVLYITGLGRYEATINGNKVGDGFLTPGWTSAPSVSATLANKILKLGKILGIEIVQI